jgi:hypothetical protein
MKKRKRGIHTGQKGSSFTSQRIHAQFGGEGENVAYHSKKGVSRVQRMLQDRDQQANSAWVCNFVYCRDGTHHLIEFRLALLLPVSGSVLIYDQSWGPSMCGMVLPYHLL